MKGIDVMVRYVDYLRKKVENAESGNWRNVEFYLHLFKNNRNLLSGDWTTIAFSYEGGESLKLLLFADFGVTWITPQLEKAVYYV